MVFLVNALALSIKRIIVSLINIILFRFVYEFVRSRLITGVMGFMIAMYSCDYIRKFAYKQYSALRKRTMLNSKNSKIHEFNPKNLESTTVDYNQFETLTDLADTPLKKTLVSFKEHAHAKCKNDLFDFIFNAATHSFFLSFATMIGIEYVQSTYQYGVIVSILYCASLPFIVCFGSSYRYSSIVCEDWLEMFEPKQNRSHTFSKKSGQTLVFYNKSKQQVTGEEVSTEIAREFVCLWSSLYDVKTKVTTIELKFMSSAFADNLNEIVYYYLCRHVDMSSDTTNEYFDFVIADFYNTGSAFSNQVKKSKLQKLESWTEFILMPMINFSVSIYSNKKIIPPPNSVVKLKKTI